MLKFLTTKILNTSSRSESDSTKGNKILLPTSGKDYASYSSSIAVTSDARLMTQKTSKSVTSIAKQTSYSKENNNNTKMASGGADSKNIGKWVVKPSKYLAMKAEKIKSDSENNWMISIPAPGKVDDDLNDNSLLKVKEEKFDEPAVNLIVSPNTESTPKEQTLNKIDDTTSSKRLVKDSSKSVSVEKKSKTVETSNQNPEENNVSEEKSFAVRRSQRQSICVDKLNYNYDSPHPKSNTERKSVSREEKSVPCETANALEAVKKSPLVLKIARRRSEHVKLSNGAASDDQFEIVRSKSENSSTPTSNKRLRETSAGSSNKAKKHKLNLSTPEPLKKDVVDEVIEDIWNVSVMSVNNEPTVRFLVKWDGFDPSENTYEPYEHISHVGVLKEYVQRKFDIHQDRIDSAMKKLLTESRDVYDSFKKKPKSFMVKKLETFDELQFKCNILAFIYTYEKIPNLCQFMQRLRFNNVLNKFYEKMKKEKAANEKLIQTISENDILKVSVENLVDYEPVPSFKYLKRVKYQEESKTKTGCDCKGGCSKNSNCCPQKLGHEFVYDVDERLFAKSYQMIVECSDYCKCDSSCTNRPKKVKLSVCIFKTESRGWGLRTLQPIPVGAFVVEYTGELIDQEAAKKRSRIYDKNGNNYLFDLDYNDTGEATYSIDATNEGNLSRFINHSCGANLQTWPATSCSENIEMHRLYYFSLRAIKAGEELTVDYSGGVLHSSHVPSKHAVTCKCGSSLCKGFLF